MVSNIAIKHYPAQTITDAVYTDDSAYSKYTRPSRIPAR